MTDHDQSSGDSGHLDDEVLSAVLDGEATPADSAHTDRCDACSARLGELRDASLLVRTPVPLADDAARDAAVAAALAAVAESNVVPMRRRPVPAWLAAAAAVVVVAMGVVALANRGDDADQTAAGNVADESAVLDTTSVPAPFAATGIVDAGDLGEVEDADLRAAVEAAFSSRTERATAADSDAGAAGGGSDGAASATAAAPSCETTVRDGNPDLGPLVLRATGTYDGEPIAVLAFDVTAPDGNVTRWVYVVTVDACAIKNLTTYRA